MLIFFFFFGRGLEGECLNFVSRLGGKMDLLHCGKHVKGKMLHIIFQYLLQYFGDVMLFMFSVR